MNLQMNKNILLVIVALLLIIGHFAIARGQSAPATGQTAKLRCHLTCGAVGGRVWNRALRHGGLTSVYEGDSYEGNLGKPSWDISDGSSRHGHVLFICGYH